jgi:hypothetical protein
VLSHCIIYAHIYRIDNRLIPQVLTLYDDAGRFCRREEASGRAAVGPWVGKIEGVRDAHKGARRVSIVAGIQLESG